jgi:hypothetical protein
MLLPEVDWVFIQAMLAEVRKLDASREGDRVALARHLFLGRR